MIKMGDLDEAWKDLDRAIGTYYDKWNLFYSVIGDSCDQAVHQLDEQINKTQDELIKELWTTVFNTNNNVFSFSFLLDIAISVLPAPIIGHAAEKGLNKLAKWAQGNRESIFYDKAWDIFSEANQGRILSSVLNFDYEKHVKWFAPFSNDYLNNYASSVIPAIKQEASRSNQKTFTQISEETKKKYTDTQRIANKSGLPISEFNKAIKQWVNTQHDTVIDEKNSIKKKILKEKNKDKLIQLTNDCDKISSELKPAAKSIQDDLVDAFEALLWIYYLGSPHRWAEYHGKRGEGATRKSVDIDKAYDVPWPQEWGKGAPPYYHGVGSATVFYLKVNLPKSLFDHFLDHFKVAGTGLTFREWYDLEKRKALKATGAPMFEPPRWGAYGTRAPHTDSSSVPRTHISDPGSPDYNSDDYAGYKLVEWFKQLNDILRSNSVNMTSMIKKVTGVDVRVELSRKY